MVYKPIKKRENNPQASLIPELVWFQYFSKKISKREIKIIKELPSKLNKADKHSCHIMTTCLCILYGHPQISAREFLDLLKNDLLLMNAAAHAAAITNRIDIIKLIATYYRQYFSFIIEKNAYSVITTAIAFSSLSVVKLLINSASENAGDLITKQAQYFFPRVQWRPKKQQDEMIEYLLSLVSEHEKELTPGTFYELCHIAARMGSRKILEHFKFLFPNKIEQILEMKENDVFSEAIRSGNVEAVRLLLSIAPEKARLMLISNNYNAFFSAVSQKNIEIVKLLCRLSPSDTPKMISVNEYDALYYAATYGTVQTFNYLVSLLPDSLESLVKANHFKLFCGAVTGRNEAVIKKIMKSFPHLVPEMIESNDFYLFHKVASQGNLKLLKLFIRAHPEQTKKMLQSENGAAFKSPLHIVNYFATLEPELTKNMIAANDYAAFHFAVWNGDFKLVKRLVSLCSDTVPSRQLSAPIRETIMRHSQKIDARLTSIEQEENNTLIPVVPNSVMEMVCSQKLKAFHDATSSFDRESIHIVKFLISILSPSKAKEIVLSDNYSLFEHVHDSSVLEYLFSIIPEHVMHIIRNKNYNLFHGAAVHSNFDLMRYLMRLAPNEVHAMIRANNFSAFQSAVHVNHDTLMMRYLISIAPESQKAMVVACASGIAPAISAGFSNEKIKYLMELEPDCLIAVLQENHYSALKTVLNDGCLEGLKFIYQCMPKQTMRTLESDKTLMRGVIQREYLDVLEFILSCTPRGMYHNIFVHPETPCYSGYRWSEKAGEMEWLLSGATSKIFFENPKKLSQETQYQTIKNFLSVGYIEIAQALILYFYSIGLRYTVDFFAELFMIVRFNHQHLNALSDFFLYEFQMKTIDINNLLKNMSKHGLPGQWVEPVQFPLIKVKQ